MRRKKKKQDIIRWNKVQVSKKVWDKLSPATQYRIRNFVDIITEKEVREDGKGDQRRSE